MNEQERHQLDDLQKTAQWLFIAIASGVVIVILHFFSEVLFATMHHDRWEARGSLFTALLWAAAWFSVSFLLGFIFGIPKVLQTTPNVEPSGSNASSNAASSQASAVTPRSLRVNTNLEEISDWLTKILVGAGLTQLVRVPGAIRSISTSMAKGMEESTPTFSAALLVYFSTLGFLSGYLLTRMFISLAFARADRGTSFPDTRPLDDIRFEPDGMLTPSLEARAVASQLNAVAVSSDLTLPQAVAVSKAASIQGQPERALEAARLAVAKAPSDALAHLSLAWALSKSGHSTQEVIAELKLARARSDIRGDPRVAEDIYNSLIYLCLYLDPPFGFNEAISLGEEFQENASPSNASLWLNLACAYGQKYWFLTQRPAADRSRGELQSTRDKALRCVQEAVKLNPGRSQRLREVLHGNGPNPEDDDLRVFEDDPDFRKALGEE